MRLHLLGVDHQDVSLRTGIALSILLRLGSACLLLKENIGHMLLYLLWVDQQSISFLGFAIPIDLHLLPPFHFPEIDIGQMRFWFLRIENQIISIDISLRLFDRIVHVLVLFLAEINHRHMRVYRSILNLVLAHFRLLPL
jgi:hypothetical protein